MSNINENKATSIPLTKIWIEGNTASVWDGKDGFDQYLFLRCAACGYIFAIKRDPFCGMHACHRCGKDVPQDNHPPQLDDITLKQLILTAKTREWEDLKDACDQEATTMQASLKELKAKELELRVGR